MATQDFDLIETPENVELERRLAGIASRFMAGLVDNILLAGLFLVLVLAALAVVWAAGVAPSGLGVPGDSWVVAFLIALVFAIYWGYFAFFEMWMNGQTPGKKALKIRVVRQDGSPITFLDVAIRNLLRAVDGIGGYGVGGLVMFITKKAQRLGDLAAGTVVVSEQVPDYSATSDRKTRQRWQIEVGAAALRATALKPEELQILSNYWARRHELALETRLRLLPKLVQPILARTGQQLPDQSLSTIEDYIFMLLTQAAAAEGKQAPEGPVTWEGKA
jgi:uncharacterized RDD family membrane protein YckC